MARRIALLVALSMSITALAQTPPIRITIPSTIPPGQYDLVPVQAPAPPITSTTISGPTSGKTGEALTFTATVQGGTAPYAYSWGGGLATGQTVTNTWTAAGTYPIALSVTDAKQQTGAASLTVTITAPPVIPPAGDRPSHLPPYNAIPNFGAKPTLIAARAGRWADPATWSTGKVPAAGDVVEVGTVITIDTVNDEALKAVSVVPGGTIQHSATAPTRLTVQTLTIQDGGSYTIGTPEQPIPAGIRAEIVIPNVPIDLASDPNAWSNGVLCLGRMVARGAPKTPYVRLATAPVKGETTLRFEAPVTGWQAGDQLCVCGSSYWNDLAGDPMPTERRRIASISPDGLVVTLQQALAFDHPGASGDKNPILDALRSAGRIVFDKAGTTEPTLRPHVANLSRNVCVMSQAAQGTRAHVFVHHNATFDCDSVQWMSLGRTTMADRAPSGDNRPPNGRYPMQFSGLSSKGTARVTRSTIWCGMAAVPQKWAVVSDAASACTVADSVIYNWSGAGVFINNTSLGNRLERNLIAGVRGSGVNRDFGHEGQGIFSWETDVVLRGNIASGCAKNGIEVHGSRPAPSGLTEWVGNETYGSTNGLSIWNLQGAEFGQHGYDLAAIPWSTIKDQVIWNCWVDGVGLMYQCINLGFDGLVVRNCSRAYNTGEYEANGLRFTMIDLQRCEQGLYMPYRPAVWNATFKNVWEQLVTVKQAYLRNQASVWSETPAHADEPVSVGPATFQFEDVIFGPPITVNANAKAGNVVMHYRSPGPAQQTVHLLQKRNHVFKNCTINGQVLNFRTFWNEQRPDYVVPESKYGWYPDQRGNLFVGAPVGGMTNQQLATSWKWRTGFDPTVNRWRIQYWPTGQPEPAAIEYAQPWLPAVIASELAPANAVDGAPFGVGGLIQRQ